MMKASSLDLQYVMHESLHWSVSGRKLALIQDL